MGLLDILGVGLNLASQLGTSCPAQAGSSGTCPSVHVQPLSDVDALGSLPFTEKMSILHETLVTARSLVEDQGPMVPVPKFQLHEVLDKVKAMEDQINQLLASKYAEIEVPSSNVAGKGTDNLDLSSGPLDNEISQQAPDNTGDILNTNMPSQAAPESSSSKLSSESVSNSPTDKNTGSTSPSTDFYTSSSPSSDADSPSEENQPVNLGAVFKETTGESENTEEFETTEITSTIRITTTTTITTTVTQSVHLSKVQPSASNAAVIIPAESEERLYPTEAYAVSQLQDSTRTKTSDSERPPAQIASKTSISPPTTSRQLGGVGDNYPSLTDIPGDIVSQPPSTSPVPTPSRNPIALDTFDGIGPVAPSGFRTVTLPSNSTNPSNH